MAWIPRWLGSSAPRPRPYQRRWPGPASPCLIRRRQAPATPGFSHYSSRRGHLRPPSVHGRRTELHSCPRQRAPWPFSPKLPEQPCSMRSSFRYPPPLKLTLPRAERIPHCNYYLAGSRLSHCNEYPRARRLPEAAHVSSTLPAIPAGLPPHRWHSRCRGCRQYKQVRQGSCFGFLRMKLQAAHRQKRTDRDYEDMRW
jgi:hypothetical protein